MRLLKKSHDIKWNRKTLNHELKKWKKASIIEIARENLIISSSRRVTRKRKTFNLVWVFFCANEIKICESQNPLLFSWFDADDTGACKTKPTMQLPAMFTIRISKKLCVPVFAFFFFKKSVMSSHLVFWSKFDKYAMI